MKLETILEKNNHKKITFMKNYHCKKCSTLVQSNNTPASAHCPSGSTHSWTDLGEVGDKNYQCKKCGTLVKSSTTPRSAGCLSGSTHSWNKL